MVPTSHLVPPFALSTGPGTGVLRRGPRFGFTHMGSSWQATRERGQGVSSVPAAVVEGACGGSHFLRSYFHRLPQDTIFVCGKQP